jgi:glycosyltransferase involved in cell wall biosynthesis
MIKSRITVCVPIFGRPQRTQRVIDCLLNQSINNYDIWLIGDNCPQWGLKLRENNNFTEQVLEQYDKGNRLYVLNLPENHGGYGYYVRNMIKHIALAPYVCFVDNDDWVAHNHLEHYLSEIENTDLDFVYYNTWNNALNILRNTEPKMGLIGHSELIIRTDFFRGVPNQTPEYGHDWKMIEWMIQNTTKHKKANSKDWTYKVMGTPAKRETEID